MAPPHNRLKITWNSSEPIIRFPLYLSCHQKFWLLQWNSGTKGPFTLRVFLFFCLIKHFFRRFQTLILSDQTFVLGFDFAKTVKHKNRKTVKHFCPSDQMNIIYEWSKLLLIQIHIFQRETKNNLSHFLCFPQFASFYRVWGVFSQVTQCNREQFLVLSKIIQ